VLGLEGEVTVDVAAQPRSIVFGEVPKGTQPTRELSLQVQEPERVKIASVTVDDPRFVLVRKSGQAAGSSSYELRLVKPGKLGRLSATIHVELSGTEPSTLDVPISGEIVGDLRYPKALSFRKTGEAFPSRELTITSRSNKPVHVLGVEDAGHLLTSEITQPKGDKAVVRLSVSKPQPGDAPTVQGKLVVRTTDRDEPQIEIEYTVAYIGRVGAGPGLRAVPDRVKTSQSAAPAGAETPRP
jgi:hypothetical protein